MSKQEEMLNKLRDALSKRIIEHFDSIDRFESKYILNSNIAKDSPFENKIFCSEIFIAIDTSIPLIEILMGESQIVSLFATASVASSDNQPVKGKDLNLWTYNNFKFDIEAEISMDEERKEIIVSNFSLR